MDLRKLNLLRTIRNAPKELYISFSFHLIHVSKKKFHFNPFKFYNDDTVAGPKFLKNGPLSRKRLRQKGIASQGRLV
jgi:hypothetical protein